MSALGVALSTFNSCNKAGSIPHFTQHLTRFPNDYQALKWRGKAYGIIGKTAEAKADFQKASRVSSGPKKLLAQAHIEMIDGNVVQNLAILHSTTRQYPNCSEAWFDLGNHTYHIEKKVDLSLQHLGRANNLAAINSETCEPWYPWCNQMVGDIYFYEKQQVKEARKHYETALRSCNTLTVGHLGLSRCDILENNLAEANRSFLTAKSLNPVLVNCETFNEFCQHVKGKQAFDSFLSVFSKLFSDETAREEADEPHKDDSRALAQSSWYVSNTENSQYDAPQLKKVEPRPSQGKYGSSYSVGERSRYARAGNDHEQDHVYFGLPKLKKVEQDTPRRDYNSLYSTFVSSRYTRAANDNEPDHSYCDSSKLKEVEPNSKLSYQSGHSYLASATSRRKRVESSSHPSHSKHRRNRGSGGAGGGNGGSSDGSCSDGEVSTPEQKAERAWKNIKDNASSKKKYRGKYFYRSLDKREGKECWYSKIKAFERHGGAFFKKYEDRGRSIVLVASLDENMREMTAKHESGKYAVIKKSDMDGES